MRHLIIDGPGGRGKTFFARQILRGLNVIEQSLWLDCGNEGSFASNLGDLMAKALPEGQLRTQFRELFEPLRNHTSSTPALQPGSDLEEFVRKHLLSAKLSPLYLVLDDADRIDEELEGAEKAEILAEEENTVGDPVNCLHWLIKRFAGHLSCLRIIATVREEKMADRLYSLLRKQTNQIGRTRGQLKPFSPHDVREFFKAHPLIGNSLETADYEKLIEHIPGEPLILSQMAKHIDERTAGERKEWLHKIIQMCQEEKDPERKRTKVLYEVFEEQFERLVPDAQTVVLAVAMLNELSIEPAAEGLAAIALAHKDTDFPALIARCLNWDRGGLNSDARARVSKTINELVEREILEQDRHRFFYDSGLEFALGKLAKYPSAGAMRNRVAKAMEERNRQDLATWHKLQIPQLSQEALSEAFHFYMDHFGSLMIRDLLPMMRRLCSEFRVRLWKEESGVWDHDALIQSIEWYINLGRYAEVIYYGYSLSDVAITPQKSRVVMKDQSLWDLIKLALEGLDARRRDKSGERLFPLLQDTHVRCLLLRAVLVFEQEVPEEDPHAKLQKPRNNLWLAGEMEKILEILSELSKNHLAYKPPFVAMVQNFRGCYYNGGGREAISDSERSLDRAILAFDASAKELDDYEACLPVQGVVLTEMHRHGFVRDRLDLANNWSRSRFLLYGPARAMDAGADKPEVQRFRKLVDAAEGTHNDTIEYSYCLVDLCFYLFAAQDLSNMEEYLDRAYVHKSVVAERRKKGITTLLISPEETSVPPAKRQYDRWVEGGIDLLEVMHYASTHSMRSGDHAAHVKDGFLFCKDQYLDFGYSRDACMAEVDSILVDIWAGDDPVLWKKKLIEIVATLMVRGANDEPIAVGLVNYLKAVIILGSSDRKNNGDKEAGIGMISPLVHEHVAGAEIPVALTSQIEEMLLKPIDHAEVEATIMRFPGLIGPDSQTRKPENWRPPFIMRGALMMTPVVRSPQPTVFPDLNYIPC